MIYTSATPSDYERKGSQQIVEQVIRPTGLVDPEIVIKPVTAGAKSGASKSGAANYPGQIHDFIVEAEATIKKGDRVMATTLTKKMAEDLSEYLKEKGIKTRYLHSDIKTMERIDILTQFRRGFTRNGDDGKTQGSAEGFDCLVGVNLLREGLDLPEVSLIGILDADKEGFLRSDTSLIQTIGRAARNAAGRVILYADNMTGSLDRAIKETERRRAIQTTYNKEHGITPQTIHKAIHDITDHLRSEHDKAVHALLTIDEELARTDPKALIRQKEEAMNDAVKELDFETAALVRDEMLALRKRFGLEDKALKAATTKLGITAVKKRRK